jgi:hypothetical protein
MADRNNLEAIRQRAVDDAVIADAESMATIPLPVHTTRVARAGFTEARYGFENP